MASKKPVRARKPAAEKKVPAKDGGAQTSGSGSVRRADRTTWLTSAGAVAVVCLLVAAIMFAAREPAPTAETLPTAVPESVAAAPTAPVPSTPAPKPAAARPASRPAPSAPKSNAVAPGAPANVRAGAPVTLTGCVQRDDGGFVLKNAKGADAPRSRSWKSGFLTKRSAPVTLSDPASAAHLDTHVGERVTVTGTLSDRRMAVQSLRRVAAACE